MSELNRTVARIEDSPRSRDGSPIVTSDSQVGFKSHRIDPPHPLSHSATSNRPSNRDAEPAGQGGSGSPETPDSRSKFGLDGLDLVEKLVDQAATLDTSAATKTKLDAAREDPLHVDRERLLRLHAADLIREIQGWADDLDRRECQLNTRDALLDERQRQLRTWEKFKRQEIEDTSRLTERLQQEAKERLQRIAAMEL